MAYSTIPKGSLYINALEYTGNGATTREVTGVGFKPDMIWIKSRTSTDTHGLFDIVRGVTKRLVPNDTSAEGNQTNGVKAFLSDGFTLGDAGLVNQSYNYISWNWLAGGSQGSSNTDGSINTTYTSVNTTSGCSISTYTGNGSASTIGHGLGVVPKMIMVKSLSTTGQWAVQHTSLGAGKWIELDSDAAADTSTPIWNNTEPTSSVFTVGTNARTNTNGTTYVAYCFANVKGYSKMGSYIGNGNADGPFIYTGFKPAFILGKRTTSAGGWWMLDNKRDGYNVTNRYLLADSTQTEASDGSFATDFLSNGWKARTNNGNFNTSGNDYIYMAFAENPFVATSGSDAIPVTAR